MTTGRQDAWTAEEDRLLAQLVLAHIREGSTQLKAFKEAGGKLARTAAACGFRWNSYVRKQYQEEIASAKEERKKIQRNRPLEAENERLQTVKREEYQLSIQDIIHYLNGLQESQETIQSHSAIYKDLEEENEALRKKGEELEGKLQMLQAEYERLKAEHFSLLSILEKARKMAAN